MLKHIIQWFLILTWLVILQSLNPKDNELCKAITKTNDNYECKTIDQCPSVLQAVNNREMYPKICRFHGQTPVVCCPTSLDTLSQKFTEKCKKYYSLTMKGGGTIDSGGCSLKRDTRMNNNHLTIVGGTVAEEGEFSHMVVLGFGAHLENVEWFCGGSLISDQYVLSAAHCSEIVKKGPVKWALLGDNDLGSNKGNANPQIREIIGRILHPNYMTSSVYNDIGLYRLNAPVKFNKFILPICINTEMELVAKQAIAIGWGRTNSAGPTSNTLMKVSLDIVEQNECNHSYAFTTGNKLAFGINPSSQLCAGKMEGGKDTCQGDSGGSLLIAHPQFECMYMQVGITSFGKLCGEPNAPGVYTRVSNYVSWIDSIVWPNVLFP